MNIFKYLTDNKYRQAIKADKIYQKIEEIAKAGKNHHRNLADKTLPTEVQVSKFTKINIPARSDLVERLFINNYCLDDLDKAYQGEVYVKYTVDRYTESVLRNGFKIVSENAKVVQYLNKRFQEFELSSDSTTNELLRDFTSSLILYGNAFLVRYRNSGISSGKPWRRSDGKDIPPIASLFIEDSRKIHIAVTGANRYVYVRVPNITPGKPPNILNKFLLPFGYSQYAQQGISYQKLPLTWGYNSANEVLSAISSGRSGKIGEYRIYRDLDMCHVRYHHTPGEKWSMPPFWPVLGDVDTLRRIEENIELLMYQFGHPLLHAKVGDTNKPGVPEEVQAITSKIANMEGNGFISTDQRVTLDYVGAEGKAIRAEEYLHYFKQRVFTGLWLSQITAGEGDVNRATAETVDMIRQDKTIEIQHIIAAEFKSILIELLVEGGVDLEWALKSENIPSLHFPEVDLGKKISYESHIINQYNSNLITESEARMELGRKPLMENERSGLFVFTVQSIAALIKLGFPEAAEFALGRLGGAANTAASIIQPANQYGKKQGPSQAKNPKIGNR